MRPLNNMGLSPGLLWETAPVTYVAPNMFKVTGVDRFRAYSVGSVVFIPGINAYAGVVNAKVATDTYVGLSDAVCFPGMSAVALISSATSKDACVSPGYAISGGSAGGGAASYAFQNTLDTRGNVWLSSQTSTGVVGYAWIGFVFATARKIRWFQICQDSGLTYVSPVSSVIFQGYNGGTWYTIATQGLQRTCSPEKFIYAVPSIEYSQARLVANGGLYYDTPSYWGVANLQFGE